jgi:hypothetical protein
MNTFIFIRSFPHKSVSVFGHLLPEVHIFYYLSQKLVPILQLESANLRLSKSKMQMKFCHLVLPPPFFGFYVEHETLFMLN